MHISICILLNPVLGLSKQYYNISCPSIISGNWLCKIRFALSHEQLQSSVCSCSQITHDQMSIQDDSCI